MTFEFASDREGAIPLHVIESTALETWCAGQPEAISAWVSSSGFTAALGTHLLVPDGAGRVAMVLAGYGDAAARARGRFHLAGVAQALPEGDFRIEGLPPGRAEEEALGWLLASHAFDRYAAQKPARARLVAPAGVDPARLCAIAAGEALTRDLINTPASDMGPSDLEAACVGLAARCGASVDVIRGDALLDHDFPMIHTVGRAAADAPRLIDLRWGTGGPALTLVGKGVTFDTGGLNLKPASAMKLMKKDMGGAATVLGLAQMIMTLALPLRLRVLIPAAENAVSGNAFRPGDILTCAQGADGGGQQHRCRGAAGAGRCAGLRGRGRA